MTFDPFGWAARWVPERWLHGLIRVGGAALFAVFFALRVRQYADFALKPLWVAETAIYGVLAAAFLARFDPVDRSRGVNEVALPVLGALLPFGLLLSPPHPFVLAHPALLRAVFWWMAAASCLTVWGMGALGRSFSITVEARALVTSGPYRWVRHPVYLGELLTAVAVCGWRFSAANVALAVALAAVQLWRARLEEQKLARHFPDFSAWRRGSWWVG